MTWERDVQKAILLHLLELNSAMETALRGDELDPIGRIEVSLWHGMVSSIGIWTERDGSYRKVLVLLFEPSKYSSYPLQEQCPNLYQALKTIKTPVSSSSYDLVRVKVSGISAHVIAELVKRAAEEEQFSDDALDWLGESWS